MDARDGEPRPIPLDAFAELYPDPTGAALPDRIAALAAEPGLSAAKLAFTVLSLARSHGRLPAAHAGELARLDRREAVLERELAVIVEALDRCGAQFVVLRGPSLGRCYPEGWKRQFNDVDVLVRDERPVPAALEALAAEGYYVARPVVSRRSRRRVWLGIALNKQTEGLGHPMYLDLTTLGPGLDRTRAFELPEDAWQGVVRVPVGRAEVPMLDLRWQAAVFAVELVERAGDYVARDALDLWMLDRAGVAWPDVDAVLAGVPAARRALADVRRAAALPAEAGPAAEVPAGPAGWRRGTVDAVDRAVRGVKRRNGRVARVLVERAPTRAWYRAGLPVFLMPPRGAAGPPLRGGRGPMTAGLRGYRGRLFPLVPPGYAAVAFAPAPTPDTVDGARGR